MFRPQSSLASDIAKVFMSVGAYENPAGDRRHRAWLPDAERAAAEAEAAADPNPTDMVKESGPRDWRLVDAHQIAGWVTHGEVPRAPRLLGRLLHDLGAGGAYLLERGVEVVGVEVDAVQGALGDEGGERIAVGGAAVQVVREDDRDAGLRGGADGDPAEAVAGDVVAQFEAERVAVEGQCEVGVMDLDEALGESEIHARNAREPAPRALLRSCSACGSGG